MKKIIAALIFMFFISFGLNTALSATFKLDKIGGLSTEGKSYPEWWYTGTDPLFVGTAAPSAAIAVKINETTANVTADASGNWSYQSTMANGDYQVSFTTTEGNIAFTLHIGQNVPVGGSTEGTTPVTPTSEATGVPDTGSNQLLGITLSLASALFACYIYLNSKDKALATFERRVVQKL